MSRKTRKLMWSVPLIAAVAVIGALAAFVVLSPSGVLAHQPGPGIAEHLPPNPASGITVTTPSAADGGRTSLRLSWNAPDSGDSVMTYRVDVSTDAKVWNNVTRDLSSADAAANCTSADAGDRCFTAGNADRDADGALMPSTEYHFRVFAINDFGTSGISVNKTTGSGETLPIEPPDPSSGLAATNYYVDKIELEWQAPADDGGADVVWYCINVTSAPDGPFTTAANLETGCLDATNATTEPTDIAQDTAATNLVDGLDTSVDTAFTIVVSATREDDDGNVVPVTNYSHEGLGGRAANATATPPVIGIPDVARLRYQVWVVTDDNGTDAGGRRMSLAASNVATGSTVAPPGTVSPRATMPQAPTDVRIVAYSTSRDTTTHALTDTGAGMHLYWNTPGNFPESTDDQNWDIQVQYATADGQGGQVWADAPETDPATAPEANASYATANFTVTLGTARDLTADPVVYGSPVVIGGNADSGRFRVRYVNPGANTDAAATDDDVNGQWGYGRISLPLNAADYIVAGDVAPGNTTPVTTTMPFIVKATTNGADHLDLDAVEGLRFTRNSTAPKTRIDLRWRQDTNSNMAGTDTDGTTTADDTSDDVREVRTQTAPTRYVIDRSEDGGTTWESISSVQPLGLGTTLRYTDSRNIVPGKRYTYRVFPVFISNGPDEYGWPAEIHASSEQADVPAAVQGLNVAPTEDDDGNQSTSSLTLTWNPVTQNGGHAIKGYLVQVSRDNDNNKVLNTGADWSDVHATGADPTADDYDPTTVGPDPAEGETQLEYNYAPTGTAVDGFTDTLTAGNVRWFRVIAITDENEGIVTTGGEQVDITTGAVRNPPNTDSSVAPSTGELLPTPEDITRAKPEYGQTADLAPPGDDADPTPPSKPLDVTAEAASDANTQADSDRGVYLTWNQDEDTPTPIVSYSIERKRMNTGVDALNNDEWEPLTTVTGSTSFTDSLPLRQDSEVRYYRVGSNANNQPDPNFADPVMYSLHPEMHDAAPAELVAPSNVMASSDAPRTMAFTWEDGDNADFYILVAYDIATEEIQLSTAMAGDTSGDVTGLTPGSQYLGLVIAVKGSGANVETMYDYYANIVTSQ